jgi:hypothetical protein
MAFKKKEKSIEEEITTEEEITADIAAPVAEIDTVGEIVPISPTVRTDPNGLTYIKRGLPNTTYIQRIRAREQLKKANFKYIKVIVTNNAQGEHEMTAVPVTAMSQSGQTVDAVVPFGVACELHPAIIGVLKHIKMRNVIDKPKVGSDGIRTLKANLFSPKYTIQYL